MKDQMYVSDCLWESKSLCAMPDSQWGIAVQVSGSTVHTLPDGQTITVRHEGLQAAEQLISQPSSFRPTDTSLAEAIIASASCHGDAGLRKVSTSDLPLTEVIFKMYTGM